MSRKRKKKTPQRKRNPAVVRRKKYKSRKTINIEDIRECLDLPQADAARILNVSVSTLKKRFKELMPGERWPYKPYGNFVIPEQHRVTPVAASAKKRKKRKKSSKSSSSSTPAVIENVDIRYKMGFILNPVNREVDESVKFELQQHMNYIDSMKIQEKNEKKE